MKRKRFIFLERMNGTTKHYPFKRVRTDFLESPQDQQLERVYAALAEEQQDDLQREEKRKAKIEYMKDLYEKKKKDLESFNEELKAIPKTLAEEYTKFAQWGSSDPRFFNRRFEDVANDLAERKMRKKMSEMAGIPREYVDFADFMDDIVGEPSFIDKLIDENKDEIINYLPVEAESKWLKMLKQHYALPDDADVKELMSGAYPSPSRTSEDLVSLLVDDEGWKHPLSYRKKKIATWKDKFPNLDHELEQMFYFYDPKFKEMVKQRVLALPEIHQMNSIALQAEKVARNNVTPSDTHIQVKPGDIGVRKGVNPKDALPQLHQQNSIGLQAKRIANNAEVAKSSQQSETSSKQLTHQVLSEAAKPEMYHTNPIELQGQKIRENAVVANGQQINVEPGIFSRMWNSASSFFFDPLADIRKKLQFQTPVTIPSRESSVLGFQPSRQILLPYKSFEELKSVTDTISRLKTDSIFVAPRADTDALLDFLTNVNLLIRYDHSFDEEIKYRLMLNQNAERVREIVKKYPSLIPPHFSKQIHNFI